MNGFATIATANVVATMSFVGMRAGRLTAVTVPSLVSPKGRTPDGAYPWGGSTVKDAGIVKVATVEGVFGADWGAMVENRRLSLCQGLNADGSATYTYGPATNGTEWVRGANGERFAFKTNADETALYLPIVPVRSLGYAYYTLAGVEVARDTVNGFLRDTTNEGRRQGVSDPVRYRDYRCDHLATVAVGGRIADGDALTLAESLANGDRATAESIIATAFAEGVYG
jgi:hypothetical protein